MLAAPAQWLAFFRSSGVSARLVAKIVLTTNTPPKEGTDVLTICQGPEIYQGFLGGTAPAPASRWYFSSSQSAPVSPAFGLSAPHAWGNTTNAARSLLTPTVGLDALVSKTINISSAVGTFLFLQLVSQGLAAQTISHLGSFTGFVAGAESLGAAALSDLTGKIYIVSADGSTLRGQYLWDATAPSNWGVNYLWTTPEARSVTGGAPNRPFTATSDVVVQEGDHLVVELAMYQSVSGNGDTATIQYGAANGGDFTADTQTGLNGWIQLSQALSFAQPTGIYPPPVIAGLSNLSAEIDPAGRTLTIGQLTFEIMGGPAGGWLQTLMAQPIFLKNKLIQLYLVDKSLPFSAALPLGEYLIDDLRSTPNNLFQVLLKDFRQLVNLGTIQFLTSFASTLPGRYTTPQKHPTAIYQWACGHPLEFFTAALTNLLVPSAFLDSSLSPSSWGTSIGHYNTSRFVDAADNAWTVPYSDANSWTSFDGGVKEDVSALDTITEWEKLLGGIVLVDPAPNLSAPMVWQFHRFSPATTPVADTWGPADINELDLQESWVEHYNTVRFNYAQEIASNQQDILTARGPLYTGGPAYSQYCTTPPSFELYDQNSVTRYAGPANTTGVYRYTVDSNWLNAIGMMMPEPTPGGGSAFTGGTSTPATAIVIHAPITGFCGCRFDAQTSVPTTAPGWSIPSWAQLSTSQPAYLRFSGADGVQEIVRATAMSVNIDVYDTHQPYGLQDIRFDGKFLPGVVNFTIDQRGLFGGTPVDWTSRAVGGTPVAVEDVTIMVNLATALITRATNGMPKLRVTTPISKQPFQLGDLIAVNDQRATTYGNDHISSTIKWEIIRKEAALINNQPHIQWLLAFAYDPFAPAMSLKATSNLWFVKSP